MANSYIEYTSGLTATTYSVPFNVLSITDVNVKGYNGTTWSDLTVSSRDAVAKTITLSGAPSAFQKIRVWRNTGTTQLVDFQNGSRLSESDLDTAYQQGLFVAQEVSENASTGALAVGETGAQGATGAAGADGTNAEPFQPVAVTGATPSLDLDTYNFFDNGTLAAHTTLSFANVPTNARWTYTFAGKRQKGFDLSNASADSVTFSTSSQVSNSQGISFKTDGTKMYVLSYASPAVYQYSLSTAWDLSTASYDNVSLAFYGAGTQYRGLTFSSDGTKMIGCTDNGDSVRYMNLNTAWDLSAATNGSSLGVGSQDTSPIGVEVLADGTKVFVVGSQNSRVYVYNLSTAWNFGTSSFVGSFQLTVGTPSGIRFSGDGSYMFITDANSGLTSQFALSSPYDPLTASAVVTLSQPANTEGLAFSTDGDKLYYVTHDNVVHQYSSLSAGFALTFPSSVTFPTTLEPTATQRSFYEFFTMDGGTTVNLISQELV